MGRLIGAVLARNEAGPDRYLERVLDNLALFTDGVVVLDDNSTDATIDICKAHSIVLEVHSTANRDGWWGGDSKQSEAPARALLWNIACKHAGSDGWILIADADHELVGITPAEVRMLLRATWADAWALPLWDCWNSDATMRVDGFWQAHHHPRAWLFRALSGPFNARNVHTGHAPLRAWNVGLMPAGAAIQHLGYVKRTHRKEKMRRYLGLQNAAQPANFNSDLNFEAIQA